ncbi:MAG TPA: peptidylprolyl isomerase [Stellaceae bacterium]|nr:peptidylprolyl isomerase [Stellaceae bacterium]
MSPRVIAGGTALLAFLLAAAAPPNGTPSVAVPVPAGDPVVARVGATEIKASEVKHMLDALDPQARKQTTASAASLATFVKRELGLRAILDEAKQKKWDQRPEVVAKVNQIIAQSYLTSIATPPANSVTDDQVRSVYDGNQTKFMQPRRYHLAQIFIAVASGATQAERDAAKAKAQDLAKKAHEKGADFAALARANSDDKPSADKGGDLGWLADSSLKPAVASVVQGLGENETSGPIETPEGWHIVRELGTKPAGPATLDEAKPTIAAAIRQEQTERAAEVYLQKLLNDDKAAVNEIELGKLVENSGG